MARSSYVYVVMQNGYPNHAFTVKRELADHLATMADLSAVAVFRICDGRRFTRRGPVLLDSRTLEEVKEIQ